MNKYETINGSNYQQNLIYNNYTTNFRNNYNNSNSFSKSFNNIETNNYDNYNNNSTLNYFEIKNIVRNEFAELIIPYQKQLNNYDNIVNRKINDIESNLKGIIDSKSFENLNQTAQMINRFLKNQNLNFMNRDNNIPQNNNVNNNIKSNNNLENKLNLMLKNQYDNKFDVLERQINSMDSLLKTFQKTFDSNMLDILKNNELKRNYVDSKEYEKFKKDYDFEMQKIKDEQKKIQVLNNQTEEIFKRINALIIENKDNKTVFLNEINILKKNSDNIDKIIFELENKINQSQIERLNEINFDDLKNLNIYEIEEIKEKYKSLNNNIDILYERLKSNDKYLTGINNKYNELEQNINYISKDVDFLNNQNLNLQLEEINKKFEELNNKLEEYYIRNKSITNKMENIDKIIHDEENNNDNKNHEKNINNENGVKTSENENIFGLTGSRRQRRNLTKSEISASTNKINNLNIDENTTKILKKIEDFNIDNINKKLENLSNENKMLLSKMETNNENFMNINEQENKLNLKIDELNKKVKESENRLYLLELKNFGSTNENDNNNEQIKENKSPFTQANINKEENSLKNEKNKTDKNNDFVDGNIYNNNNDINLFKNNENELIEKIINEEKNDYKELSSDVANKEDKSFKDISISSLIKPILDDNKNRKSNDNNSKIKEGETNNKNNNDIDNYDDFDDI